MQHVWCSTALFNFKVTCIIIKLKWSTLNLILHFGGAECSCSCISIVTCSSVTVLYCMRSGYCIWSYNEQNISNLIIVKDYGPLGCSGHCLPLALPRAPVLPPQCLSFLACAGSFCTLKMEAAVPPVCWYPSTWRHIPEDCVLFVFTVDIVIVAVLIIAQNITSHSCTHTTVCL